jgi:hypothetical protein
VTITKPKFLITRFAYGAGGKFLSTVLQTSTRVAHWCDALERHKQDKMFADLCIEYCRRSFPHQHSAHLQCEPMVPYNTDLYSVGFPRGDDVTLPQYLAHARTNKDFQLLEGMAQDQHINLIFNKATMPVFCHGSRAVTITVESQKEQTWLHHSRWSKHFLVQGSEIRYLPSDPEYCNFRSLPAVLKHGNQYRFALDQQEDLWKRMVVENSMNLAYQNPEQFVEPDTQNHIQNINLALKDLLDPAGFVACIDSIFEQFQLGEPNLELVAAMHAVWLERQLPW